MTAIPPCHALESDGTVQVPLQRTSGVQAIVMRCLCRLQTVRGSWLSDRSVGAIDIDAAISRGARYDGESYRLAVREQLSQVVGVVRVGPVRRFQGGLSVTITVDAGDGDRDVDLGASPYADGDPMTWYVMTGAFGGPLSKGY